MNQNFIVPLAVHLKIEAEAELSKGNLPAAGQMLDEALRVLDGVQSQLRPHILIARGDTFWHTGNLSAARSCYEEALGLFAEASGAESVVVGLCLHSLSEIYGSMGDALAAHRFNRRACRILRKGAGISG